MLVEFLLHAVEYMRKYTTDVKDLVLTQCLVQIQETRVLQRSSNFLKETLLPRNTVKYHGDQSNPLQLPSAAVVMLME